jgi:hypothetical protein
MNLFELLKRNAFRGLSLALVQASRACCTCGVQQRPAG